MRLRGVAALALCCAARALFEAENGALLQFSPLVSLSDGETPAPAVRADEDVLVVVTGDIQIHRLNNGEFEPEQNLPYREPNLLFSDLTPILDVKDDVLAVVEDSEDGLQQIRLYRFQDGAGMWSLEQSLPLTDTLFDGRRGRRRTQDIPDIAGVLSCNMTVEGQLLRNEVLTFEFDAPSRQQYIFSTCESDFDTQIEIFEVEEPSGIRGTEVGECDECGDCAATHPDIEFRGQLEFTVTLFAGRHYIDLFGFNGAPGNYKIVATCGRVTSSPSAAPSEPPSAAPSIFEGFRSTDLVVLSNETFVATLEAHSGESQFEELYLFEYNGATDDWNAVDGIRVETLEMSIPRTPFDTRLVASDGVVALGSPWHATSGFERVGRLKIIEVEDGALRITQSILPPTPREGLEFGSAMALYEDLLLVAADVSSPGRDGVVFFYIGNGSSFAEEGELSKFEVFRTESFRSFGIHISLQEEFAVVSTVLNGGTVLSYVYKDCDSILCEAGIMGMETSIDGPLSLASNAEGFVFVGYPGSTDIFDLNEAGEEITRAPTLLPSSQPTPAFESLFVSAGLSNSGSQLVVALNGPSNRANRGADRFRCSLEFEGVTLGEEVCQFVAADTLILILRSISDLQIGDEIRIRDDGSLQPLCVTEDRSVTCDEELRLGSRSVEIPFPAEPVVPVILFEGAPATSTCQDVYTLDAGTSFNNGGRGFVSEAWSVVLLTDGSINALVEEAVQATPNDVLEIPTSLFAVGEVYQVRYEATNFLGTTGAATFVFEVVSRSTPIVSIDSATVRFLKPNLRYSFASTTTPACEDDVTPFLLFEWNVQLTGTADNEDIAPVDIETGSSIGQNLLTVPEYTFLGVGSTYQVSWTARNPDDFGPTIRATATIEIRVVPADLVTIVTGCNTTISPTDFGGEAVLHTIDASGSFDPTLAPRGSQNAEEAVTSTLIFDSGVLVAPTGRSCDVTDLDIFPGAEDVSQLAVALFRGCSLSFVLSFQTTTQSSVLNQTCQIDVLDAPAPFVEINPFLGDNVNQGTGAALSASVTASELPIDATWTVVEGLFAGGASLGDVILSDAEYRIETEEAYEGVLSAAERSGGIQIPVALVVDSSALVAGVTYVFELRAVFDAPEGQAANFGETSSTISFVINAAPTSGVFNVIPAEGSYETLFVVEAPYWTDDPEDLPLQYKYEARTRAQSNIPGQADEALLLNPTQLTSVRIEGVLLPAGRPSLSSVVIINLIVLDNVGAQSQGLNSVQVAAPAFPITVAATELEEFGQLGAAENTDVVTRGLFRTGSLLVEAAAAGDAGSTGENDEEDLVATVLDGLTALQALVDGQEIEINNLRSQVGILGLLSEAVSDTNVTLSLLSVADTLVQRVLEGQQSLASPDVALVTFEILFGIILPISNSLTAESLLPMTEEQVATVISTATRIFEQIHLLRSAAFISNQDPELLQTEAVATDSRVASYDPIDEIVQVSALQSLISLENAALGTSGVDAFDEYFLAAFGLTPALFEAFGTQFSPDDPDGRILNSTSDLATEVVRVTLGLDASAAAADFPFDGGRVNISFPLEFSLDAQTREQCDRVFDNLLSVNNTECETSLVCTAYDESSASFQAVPECTALLSPDEDQVTCVCDFTSSSAGRRLGRRGRRHLSTSIDNDANNFADTNSSQTINIDFGSLLVSSGVTVQATFADLDSASSPQPVVFVVLGLFLLFALSFLIAAYVKDKDEMATASEKTLRSIRIFRAWAIDRGLGDQTVRKLSPKITCMEDVPLIRKQGAAAQSQLADSCGLNETEKGLFMGALRESLEDYLKILSGEEGYDPEREISLDPPGDDEEVATTFTDYAKGGSDESEGDKLRASRLLGGATKFASTQVDGAGNVIATHDQITTSALLGSGMWYGLLLAMPDELHTFEEPSAWTRVVEVLKSKHDLYDALSLHPGLTPTRFVRVVGFLANLITAMWINAMLFQIVYPDDEEFCEDFNGDPDGCEADASPLNDNENRCVFNSNSGICEPTEPSFDARNTAIVTAFALLFLAPLTVFFRILIETFLEESPLRTPGYTGAELVDRKMRLQQSEGKRAQIIVDEEMAHLKEHPDHVPPLYKAIWPKCLQDYLLKRKVEQAASEAVRIETELDAEYSLWASQRAAGLLSDEQLGDCLYQLKLCVTKIAVRDSLPHIKRLIFQQYATLRELEHPMPLWIRRAVLLGFFLYILGALAYLISFGLNSTSETAENWVVAVLITEVVTVALLVVVRIVVLNVVLPSIVRPDVSIERILFKMPHFSSAALLSRAREDLLPGLRFILDAGFDSDFQQTVSRRPSVTNSEVSRAESLKETYRLLNEGDAGSTDSDSEEKRPPRSNTTSQKLRMLKDVHSSESRNGTSDALDEPGKARSRSRKLKPIANATATESFVRSGDFDDEAAPPPSLEQTSELELSELGDDQQTGPPSRRLSAVVKKRKKRQVKEIQVATLASVFSRRSSIGQSFVGGSRRDQSSMLLSPTSPDGSHHAFFASKHGIISRQSSADTDDGYRHGSLPEEQAQALQASRSNSHLHTAPVSEVGRQLRQRGFCFKWVSRVVLLVFAVILLLPEPVQEMLLEEGIPVGVALLLLLGLDLSLSEGGTEALLIGGAIVAVLVASLILVWIIQRGVERNIHQVKNVVLVTSGEAEQPRAPVKSVSALSVPTPIDENPMVELGSPDDATEEKPARKRLLSPKEAASFNKKAPEPEPLSFRI